MGIEIKTVHNDNGKIIMDTWYIDGKLSTITEY